MSPSQENNEITTRKHTFMTHWLPTSMKEVQARSWDYLDVILFSGDAYVDHPAFGIAIIGRVLESLGLKVAIVPQPNWRDDLRDFKKLGIPRLFFGVTAGNMDSMVNHYTANNRIRSNDAYTPGGRAGYRPDYATIVYSRILKELYPEVPIIIGGIEASMRRATHYDYWSDSLKPGILFDSNADLLVYGMGEKAMTDIVQLLQHGVPFYDLRNIPQTAYLQNSDISIDTSSQWKTLELSPHEQCVQDKAKFASDFKIIENESNRVSDVRIIQKYGNLTLVINPPYTTISEKEIDSWYDLPFTRLPHPRYQKKEAIPAFEMIRFSVNIHRGCFGGCSFCTISMHQGKTIISRSTQSIMNEVHQIVKMPEFKGYISDLGGPSANMYRMTGVDLIICAPCTRPSCIFPGKCKNLNTSHKNLIRLYKLVRQIPLVKKAFVTSGVRYDLFMSNGEIIDREYAENLITHHISGRLKVAPEHCCDNVLKIMRKPVYSMFEQFQKHFARICSSQGIRQEIIPYFISSHPGCGLEEMTELAEKTKMSRLHLEQVQDFTPTPMTLSTVMYYTGINPYTGEKIVVAKSSKDKTEQRNFFFWYKKEVKPVILADLAKHKRTDLISRMKRL